MARTSNPLAASTLLLAAALLGLPTSGPAMAQGKKAAPAPKSEEGIAISLRELKTRLDSAETKRLFGTTRLLGFLLTEDRLGKDCILVCAQEPNRPALRLDDLAVAFRNVTAGEARPACTIDPRAEVLKQLAALAPSLTASRDPAGVEKTLREWQKVAASPQDVRVFHIDPATSFARTMVDADYDLKSICNGTAAVPGVTSFSDLALRQAKDEISRTGKLGTLDFFNRFWFNPGAVAYRTDGNLFLLTACKVVLLTEQEAVSPEGKRKGTSQASPLARQFADQFTARFDDVARAKPVYRELENLYRSVAVAGLMAAEARRAGALRVLNDSLGQVAVSKEKPAKTVAGKSAVKKLEGQVPGGTYVLWLPSCGGVSVDIQVGTMKKETAPAGQPAKQAQDILKARPEPRALTWRF